MTTFRCALDDQVQGYLDHLTIERGVAANTLSSYRRDLRRYAEHLAERGIDDLAKVTETDVSEFLVSLRRGDPDTKVMPLSAVSAARAVVAVRGLHRFATSEGLTEIDVAEVMRQLVQTLIAAVHPLHHLPNEAWGEFLLVLRRVAVPQHLRAAHHRAFHDPAGRH